MTRHRTTQHNLTEHTYICMYIKYVTLKKNFQVFKYLMHMQLQIISSNLGFRMAFSVNTNDYIVTLDHVRASIKAKTKCKTLTTTLIFKCWWWGWCCCWGEGEQVQHRFIIINNKLWTFYLSFIAELLVHINDI